MFALVLGRGLPIYALKRILSPARLPIPPRRRENCEAVLVPAFWFPRRYCGKPARGYEDRCIGTRGRGPLVIILALPTGKQNRRGAVCEVLANSVGNVRCALRVHRGGRGFQNP